jgi:DNA-binding MarR family transcriptional regulator
MQMTAKTQALPDIARLARRALERDVAWRARSVARRLVALADRGLQTSGLSHAQFILMCLIASATDDTVNALAQRAGLDQSTMSRNLDVLVKAQLAEVTTALEDRRRRAVWLTERGLFALAQAIGVASKLQPKIERAAAKGWALLGSAKRDSAK